METTKQIILWPDKKVHGLIVMDESEVSSRFLNKQLFIESGIGVCVLLNNSKSSGCSQNSRQLIVWHGKGDDGRP
jgi:hypothetical protein